MSGAEDLPRGVFRLGRLITQVLGDPVPLIKLIEPFARRALGRMREDDDLIAQALHRFEAMGLDWHASETRALISAGH